MGGTVIAEHLPARRAWLHKAFVAGALSPLLSALSGCADLVRVLGNTCPENPADSGGIGWTPDVLDPVYAGLQYLGAANRAPGPLAIYYPTHVSGPNAPILKLCLVSYPVVLFLHKLLVLIQLQRPRGCSNRFPVRPASAYVDTRCAQTCRLSDLRTGRMSEARSRA
jgi:hypothetical protein